MNVIKRAKKYVKNSFLLLGLFIVLSSCTLASPTGVSNFWNSYIEEINKKIDNNWNPRDFTSSEYAIAEYTLNKDGKLINARIIDSSSNVEFNNLAIESIYNSQPFNPLPQNYQGEYLTLEYKFKFNYLKPTYIQYPYETKDLPEWKIYNKKINNIINSNWNNKDITADRNTIISITIKNNGELADYKIKQSSQNPEADLRAIKAIELSFPFEQMPSKIIDEYINFNYVFDYEKLKEQNLNYQNLAYNTKSPEIKKYVDNFAQKLNMNFNPQNENGNNSVIITLTIKKDGKLATYNIIKSSNSEEFNSEVISAILKSMPFSPLPKEYSGEYISIKHVFGNNYNINKYKYNINQNKKENLPKNEETIKTFDTLKDDNSNDVSIQILPKIKENELIEIKSSDNNNNNNESVIIINSFTNTNEQINNKDAKQITNEKDFEPKEKDINILDKIIQIITSLFKK